MFFKDDLASLPIYHPTQAVQWLPLLCSQTAVSADSWLLKFMPRLGHQLPDARARQCFISQDLGDSEDCFRLLQVNPNVFLHILPPQSLLMIIHPSSFSCAAIGLIPLDEPSCQCKGLMTRTHQPNHSEFSPLEAALRSSLWACIYQAPWEFPSLPLYRPTQERGQTFGRSTFSIVPGASTFLETGGWH